MQNEVFTVLQNVSNVFSLINGKKENAFEHTGLIAPNEKVFNQAATILKEMGYTVKQEEVSDNGSVVFSVAFPVLSKTNVMNNIRIVQFVDGRATLLWLPDINYKNATVKMFVFGEEDNKLDVDMVTIVVRDYTGSKDISVYRLFDRDDIFVAFSNYNLEVAEEFAALYQYKESVQFNNKMNIPFTRKDIPKATALYNVLRQINRGVSCILGLNEDPAKMVRHVSIISVPNKSTTEHAKRTILAWMMTPESEYPTSLLPVSIGGCSAEDTIIVVSDQFNTDDIIAQCGMLGLGDKVMSRTSKQIEAPVILCDTAEMEEEPISKSELFRKLSSPKREVLGVREENGEFIITYFQVKD